jgi:hypothetical protein
MTNVPSPMTLPQTIVLLALSLGRRPCMAPITRRALLRAQWIAPRSHEITEAGRAALASSPWIDKARQQLDAVLVIRDEEDSQCAP